MTKKTKSTVDKFIESLSPEERKKYDEEYQELLLSELILAAQEKDEESVKKLAEMAGVSPTIVQGIISEDKKLQKLYEDIIKKYDTVLKKLAKS